jgi:hypothetical protein
VAYQTQTKIAAFFVTRKNNHSTNIRKSEVQYSKQSEEKSAIEPMHLKMA